MKLTVRKRVKKWNNNNTNIKSHNISTPPMHDESKCSLLDLPLEILPNIFSRLPIKSFILCKCVSKLFNALISNPTFSSIHRNNSFHLTAIAYIQEDSIPIRLIDFDTRTHVMSETSHHAPRSNNSREFFFVVGCCDGIICLIKHGVHNFDLILGNPMLGQFIRLPEPVAKLRSKFVMFGLGYCQISNNYKVLRIITEYKRRGVYQNKSEILTIGLDKKWRHAYANVIKCSMFSGKDGIPNIQSDMIAFNSRLHWTVHPAKMILDFLLEPDEEDMRYICGFDLKEEKVRAMHLPPHAEIGVHCSWKLGAILDMLCLYKIIDDAYLNIWVMVEYGVQASWTKQFIFKASSIPDCVNMCQLKAVALSNEGVIVISDDYKFVFYDLIGNVILTDFRYTKRDFQDVTIYIPSFITLRNLVNVV